MTITTISPRELELEREVAELKAKLAEVPHCGGIGRGPDAPYPGMIEAFEAHYGQAFTDKDWRNETGVWAAAWGHATRQAGEVHAPKVDNRAAPLEAALRTVSRMAPEGLGIQRFIAEVLK